MKVKEVVDLIVDSCDMPPLPQTCDQLMSGDWDCEVTGIVSTFMATVDVIKDTISKGANLIITHEPTYFTGADQTDWLVEDDVYLLKQKLIAENKINTWRFHDHMHITKPDKIYAGLNKELGCYIIPSWLATLISDVPISFVEAG
jgi:hypothetical protein